MENTRNGDAPESAVLVSVQRTSVPDEEVEESLDELEALALTAGADVRGRLIQKRDRFDPATLIGKGKVDLLAGEVTEVDARMVIFDNELSVTQQDRLSRSLGVKVIDRTALILDIFAQHAHTKEGRTQVELAQLSYMLPRIRGLGLELSRLGGGIGTRMGPGETKLEVDRRRIRGRMRKLESDIAQMEAVRVTQRKRRTRAGLPSVCLVGYTNSGKSSLLNRLTGAHVLVEDMLFSTLDSTTRRLELPSGATVTLSDTVGFIRKLPHELVAAFYSTLEVVRGASLLVHVVDSTNEETLTERIGAVREVLKDLEALSIQTMMVFNKVDLVEPAQRFAIERVYPGAVLVSALTGENVERLPEEIDNRLAALSTVVLAVPSGRGDLIAGLYRVGRVTASEVQDETTFITVDLPTEVAGRYSDFLADTPKINH